MIEYALLIMLGFCTGGLIALLLAPTLWRRAVRLTTKRLELTLPMSLSDIEADKDLLRASYAITIRRLESSLSKARDKSANQLVDISRLQMRIGELGNQISALELQLDERRNAANVFENTIRKRFPELENMVAAAKAALEDRAQEISDLTNTLRRREEALTMAQRSVDLQQQEITKLRETLEQRGADTTGRFKRRPSQWTLEDYRSEYDRLNVELSKMREHVILSQEREATQISVLKTELQRLGERIMASVAAQDIQMPPAAKPEPERKVAPSAPEAATPASRRGLPARPAPRTQPWPGEQRKADAPAPAAARETAPIQPDAPKSAAPQPASASTPTPPSAASAQSAQRTNSARRWTQSAIPASAAAPAGASDASLSSRDRVSDSEAASAAEAEKAARDALQTLLARGPRPSSKDNLFDPAPGTADAEAQAAQDAAIAGNAVDGSGTDTKPATAGKGRDVEDGKAARSPLTAPAVGAAGGDAAVEPKLDKVFQEIFESRGGALGNAAASSLAPETAHAGQIAAAAAERRETPALETADAGNGVSGGSNKTRTLLDRLRVMQERQTG